MTVPKNKIAVYFHRNGVTDEVFYVGIGVRFRPYRTSGRSRLWNRIVAKHGVKVEIVHLLDSWEQAQNKEKEYIKFYGRLDKKTGALANHTDGGDGTLGGVFNIGRKRSVESRQKISLALKGRKVAPDALKNATDARRVMAKWRKENGVKLVRKISENDLARIRVMNVGRKHTDQTKKKIGEKIRGRIVSQETRQKLSNALKGKKQSAEHRLRTSEAVQKVWQKRKNAQAA